MIFSSKQINTLLSELGVGDPITHVKGFWTFHHGRLDEILLIAERVYKRRQIQLAPRTLTDPDEPVRALNELWNEIKNRFAWAMSPKLIIPPMPPAWLWQEARQCKLKACGEAFIPKVSHQDYCSNKCAQKAKGERAAETRTEIIRVCDVCGESFPIKVSVQKRCSDVCQKMAHDLMSHERSLARLNKKKAKKHHEKTNVPDSNSTNAVEPAVRLSEQPAVA